MQFSGAVNNGKDPVVLIDIDGQRGPQSYSLNGAFLQTYPLQK